MKFNIKKLGLFQQLGCLIIFCMMGFSVQAACNFTTAQPVTITQTAAFSGGTQFYYLFDCDGTLITAANTTGDFGQQPYGCYEIIAVNSCPGTAPAGITSPADIAGLAAADYSSTSSANFTVCDVSEIGSPALICEGDPVKVVSTPNSYDTTNDMTYVLVCSINGGAATVSGTPVTVTAGTTPAQATLTTPVDNDVTNVTPYVPMCTVYVLNHCPTADLTAVIDGADWATVDPTGNADVASTSIATTLDNCVGLPLDLLSFDAKCDEDIVKLEWVTATEDNVKHMIVQRSINGEEFMNMGIIDAKSNGLPIETTYNFIDQRPLSKGLYRLKIVDLDGSFVYSDKITVNCMKGGFDFTEIFPNPTRKDITVNFEIQNISNNVTLTLVDVLGRVIYSDEIIPVSGLNSVSVDMSKYSSAVYTVILDNGSNQVTQRIVKN